MNRNNLWKGRLHKVVETFDILPFCLESIYSPDRWITKIDATRKLIMQKIAKIFILFRIFWFHLNIYSTYPGVISLLWCRDKFFPLRGTTRSSTRNDSKLYGDHPDALREKFICPQKRLFFAGCSQYVYKSKIARWLICKLFVNKMQYK